MKSINNFDPNTLQAHMNRGLRMRSEAVHAMLKSVGALFSARR